MELYLIIYAVGFAASGALFKFFPQLTELRGIDKELSELLISTLSWFAVLLLISKLVYLRKIMSIKQ